MNLPSDWARRWGADAPDALALEIWGGDCLSFAALESRLDALAAAVAALPVAPGRPIAFAGDDAVSLALLAVAAPRAGRALFPISPALPADRARSLLDAAGLERAWSTLPPAAAVPSSAASLDGGRVHLIIATSGSTGTPKGVMLTGANLAAAVAASRHGLSLDPGDCWLACLPMVHIGGLSILLRCLEAGATMRLHRRFDVEAVAADLADGHASHVSLVPAMLGRLLDLGCRPASRLRVALVGGAGLPVALADRALAAGWPLVPTYGMSETGSQIATCLSPAEWYPGLAGPPIPGAEIGFSASGRIRVRGPMVMAGYLTPDLRPGQGLDNEGWFETNDLGAFDDRGRLVVRGRADDILISGGENIHPSEVEALAGRCPGVDALAVTGQPDPVWGDLIVAVVTGTIGEAEFLAWCRANLPSALRPRRLVRVADLPLTAAGKPDRAALRAIAAAAPAGP